MILTALLIALLIFLVAAGSRGSLAMGVALCVLALVTLWPEVFEYENGPGLLSPLLHLLPINIGAWGVALIASSWRSRFNSSMLPLFISPFLVTASSGYYLAADPGQFKVLHPGSVSMSLLMILLQFAIVIASWSVAKRARRFTKKAMNDVERLVLWMVHSSACLGILGAGVSAALRFLNAIGVDASLVEMERIASAVAYAGATGAVLTLLYCSISAAYERERRKALLRKEIKLLEDAWSTTMKHNSELLHPLAGRTVEQRAHRMVVEIRDAVAENRGDPDHLVDELYEAVERVEDMLIGQG